MCGEFVLLIQNNLNEADLSMHLPPLGATAVALNKVRTRHPLELSVYATFDDWVGTAKGIRRQVNLGR